MSIAPTVVDLKDAQGPVVNDVSQGGNRLDMDNQPEIVIAAVNAIENLNIPNGTVSVYEHEGTVVLRNEMNAYLPGGSGSAYITVGGTKDPDIEIQNAASYGIGVVMQISENENGNYNVEIYAHHDGTPDISIEDARAASINYEISSEGEILSRKGQGVAHDDAANDWAIDAVQATEFKFATILGVIDDIKRPENAATNLDVPPINTPMENLSGIVSQLDNTFEAPAPSVNNPSAGVSGP